MTQVKIDRDFEALLDYLKRSRGLDFTGYKRTTLSRRINKRMQELNCVTYVDYIDHLEVHPDEFTNLFNTVMINVTGFFRDPPVWDFIARYVIPRILESKGPQDQIRIWSAACSTGEEAFSLAILFAEALGVEQVRQRLKIYASDVDDDALNLARQAIYNAKSVREIPPPLLEKYFDRAGEQYVFRKDLRRFAIFGRHDLVHDAPISRIDLLLCRNTLMYFNAETQTRILARFSFGLNDTGFLVLGKAEMLLSHSTTFVPVDLSRRVFRKAAKAGAPRDRLLAVSRSAAGSSLDISPSFARVREASIEVEPTAQLVVSTDGILIIANERARALFRLTTADVGRPFQDLEVSFQPVELRSLVKQASSERRVVTQRDVSWANGQTDDRTFDVYVTPLLDDVGGLLGVKVAFSDVTRYKRLYDQFHRTNQELETAYEELQSTNEELETTNEELQSTVEELETTNEELQSTNEELETLNEELQATNAELQAINDEFRQRTNELNDVNAFMESVMLSLRVGLAVLDQDQQVQVWNHWAQDMWGLRSDEILGSRFLDLDIGLPMDQLDQPIRCCLVGKADHQELTVKAVNRRGRAIACQVSLSPLLGASREIQGAILLMEAMSPEIT